MSGLQFPTNLSNTSTAPARQERVRAEFWLNVGYVVQVQVVDATGVSTNENRFVSLPVGIPLDTMTLLPTDSQNESFRAFQAARNGLHETLMGVAKTMQPGAERFIGDSSPGNLCIQLRRVSAPAAPIQSAANPFVTALKL